MQGGAFGAAAAAAARDLLRGVVKAAVVVGEIAVTRTFGE